MKKVLNPKRLTRLRGPRPWAAIVFGEGVLDMTVARGSGAAVSVLRETSADLSTTAETAPAELKTAWKVAVQTLRGQVDPKEHRVVTAIGCEDVMCQTLDLPTSQPGELKQMLDLQIDGLTPLPLEEVVYGFESLEVRENQTRVLVAIARKDAVNDRVEALETAGLPPEIVAVDALSVFRELLRRELLPRDGQVHALVMLNGAAAHVIVYTQGNPLAIRTILLGADFPSNPDAVALLREELQRTLVATETEHPELTIGRVTFLTRGDAFKAAAEQVAAGWQTRTDFLSNGTVPSAAVSLGLQSAAGATAQLNLLPDEWRQRRRAAQTRRRLITAGAIALAAYLVALGAFAALLTARRAHKNKVDAEIKQLTPSYDAARRLYEELVAMQHQLDTKSSALEVLRQTSILMPDSLKLTQFQFKKDATQTTLTLKGQAQSATLVNDFIGQLEKCELFAKVTPGQMRSEPSGLTRFDILCTLKTGVEGARPAHVTE